MRLKQVRVLGGIVLCTATTVGLLTGCGGSSAKAPAASSTGSRTGTADVQAYVSCLNQHGVTIALPSRGPGGAGGARASFSPRPRPSGSTGRGNGGGFGGGGFNGGGGFGGGGLGGLFGDANNPPAGVSQTAWAAALTACKSLQPTFNRNGAGGGVDNTALQAYLNCLKDHGVTMSASRGPGGFGSGGFDGASPSASEAAAAKACAPLRPTRPAAAPSPSN